MKEHDESADPTLGEEARAIPAEGRGWRWVGAAALLLWLMVSLPLALGQRTFFIRDIFSNHLPQKVFGAEQLRQGRIPAFNPDWGLGQVFRGNPGILPFYPDNLLHLVLPFWSAFNLHFVLHWLLALVAMATLARTLGQSPAASLIAGLTYAGCGWLLSTLSFYNLLTVAAWWPLVIAGAVVGGRRGICLGGIACGMALLGGEPITAALGLVPMLVASVPRHGWRRAFSGAFAIGFVGLLIALPQIVATARIYGFSFRGGHGNIQTQVASYYLILPRLIELVLPLPFGWPGYRGAFGVWHAGYAARLPFFMSIHFGIVALALAFAARRKGWWALAGASLLVAWGGGQVPWILDTLTLGIFRFPEKFLFWLAIALPLLAGWGLQEITASPRRWWRAGVLIASVVFVAAAAGIWLLRAPFLAGYRVRVADSPDALHTIAAISLQSWLQALYLLIAGILLLTTAWAVRRRRPAVVVACQLLALLQLAPLVQTDSTAPYRQVTPWEQKVGAGAAVLSSSMMQPPWHPPPWYPDAPDGPRAVSQRLLAQDLAQTPGVLHGLSYPFAINLEGMSSALTTLLELNLARLDWPERVRWFRTLGLDYLTTQDVAVDAQSLELIEEQPRGGQMSRLYRVLNPAPEAWWPRSVEVAPGPVDAVRWVSFTADAVSDVVASTTVDHRPGGVVQMVENAPDRIVFDVESQGGLAVVRRAFQPLFKARDETGERLRTTAVNLLLLGVEVPDGRHRVTLEVSEWPEIGAGLVAIGVLLLCAFLGWRR